MKKNQKKATRKTPRVPPVAVALGAFAVMAVVPWLLLFPDSESAPSASGGSPSTSEQWTPLVSKQHGFQVSLPAPARYLTPPGAGDIDSTWVATHAGGTFLVKVTRCPEKLCTQVPDTILESASKSAREELGGTLLSEQRVDVPCPQGTCPGLEFAATGSQGLRVSARFFATHDKVFQLLGTQTSDSDALFRKVVDSFSFL